MYLVRGSGPSPKVKDVAIACSPRNWPGSLEVKSNGYINCLKDALKAINGEANSGGIALSSRRHGLVEVNHYPRIEESVRSHKWL